MDTDSSENKWSEDKRFQEIGILNWGRLCQLYIFRERERETDRKRERDQ